MLREPRRALLARLVVRDFRAAVERVADFRAVPVLLFRAAVLVRFFVALLAALRVALLLRVPVLLREVDLFARVPLLAARRVVEDFAPPLLVPMSSSDHFPDITRCAASATASAISAPSLLALDITLVAACEAESAASSPASRILRRAAGLALIAAAAAARPAPSISRLIAALAILSTVLLVERDDDLEERFFVLDFAIAKPPSVRGKTLQARNGSRRGHVSLPRNAKMQASKRGPLAKQRSPSTWSAAGGSSRSGALKASPRERFGPTPLLNHETSDHLLSLC